MPTQLAPASSSCAHPLNALRVRGGVYRDEHLVGVLLECTEPGCNAGLRFRISDDFGDGAQKVPGLRVELHPIPDYVRNGGPRADVGMPPTLRNETSSHDSEPALNRNQ